MLPADYRFPPRDFAYGIPSSVLLRGLSRAGPLTSQLPWASPIAPASIALFCERPPCEELPTARGSSLRSDDGHDTGARLQCEVHGEPLTLSVSVEGRLPPGEYMGSLLVSVNEKHAVIPVQAQVRAWWPWMVLPLLLGVLLLSTMSFIAEQRQLAEARADAFEVREGLASLRPRIELGPPQWRTLADDVDQSVDASLRILAEPRPLSLRDPRASRAARHTAVARDDLAELQSQLPAVASGIDDIKWLQSEWTAALGQLEALRARLAVLSGVGTAASDPLGERLTLLIRELAERVVLPLADVIEQDVGLQVDRALLLAQGGRLLQARRLAVLTHDALQAGLRILVDNMELALSLGATSRDVHQRRRLLGDLLDGAGLAASDRREIEETMAMAVDSFIERPDLEGLEALHASLNRIQVSLLRKHQALIHDALEQAKDQALHDTDLGAIDAALETLPKAGDQAGKQRLVAEILGLWRQRVASFDGPRAAEMTRILDRMEGELEPWDPDALTASFQGLTDSWGLYVDEHHAALQAVPANAFCDLHARSEAFQLSANAAHLTLAKPNEETRMLQATLDRLRYRLETLPKGSECITVLVAVSAENLAIGDQLIEDQFTDLRFFLEPGIEAVRQAGFDELAARLGRLLTEPRELGIEVQTPAQGRVSDARIEFEVTQLDSAWGPSARVRIDLGDGSRLETDAERLREAGALSHRYTLPGTYRVRIVVDLGDAGEPGDALLLGAGEGRIEVARSGISEARSIALGLINTRTLLALLVAWVLQTVRLSAHGPFGARPTDYFEAFAIGAGSQAGIEGLLSLLPK